MPESPAIDRDNANNVVRKRRMDWDPLEISANNEAKMMNMQTNAKERRKNSNGKWNHFVTIALKEVKSCSVLSIILRVIIAF